MERRFQDNTLAIIVGGGVLLGVTAFGMILAMLLGKRTAQPLGNPLQLLPEGFSSPLPVIQAPTVRTALETKPSYTGTWTLSTTQPTRVMNAGSERHWTVELTNIGPPGSIARVATDTSVLAYPTMSATILAGKTVTLRVRPRDALFAIGNVAGVQLSVVASEEIA